MAILDMTLTKHHMYYTKQWADKQPQNACECLNSVCVCEHAHARVC